MGDRLPKENDDVPLNGNIFDPDLDSNICLEELKRATFHQKNNSSYGLDNVCSETIISSFDPISDYLLISLTIYLIPVSIQNRGVMALSHLFLKVEIRM